MVPSFLVVLATAALPGSLVAGEPIDWTIYGGRWGVGKDAETSELGVEARRPIRGRGLDLFGGVAATADEAFWGYVGASFGFDLNDAWEVRPGFAVSVFDEGDGKDLGGPIEFRTSLELSYRVGPRTRIGLLAYHLSNAGIYDLNPGANSVLLTVGFAVWFLAAALRGFSWRTIAILLALLPRLLERAFRDADARGKVRPSTLTRPWMMGSSTPGE